MTNNSKNHTGSHTSSPHLIGPRWCRLWRDDLKHVLRLTEWSLERLNQAVTVPLPSCRIKKHYTKKVSPLAAVSPLRKQEAGVPPGGNILTEEEGPWCLSADYSHLSLALGKRATQTLTLIAGLHVSSEAKNQRLLLFWWWCSSRCSIGQRSGDCGGHSILYDVSPLIYSGFPFIFHPSVCVAFTCWWKILASDTLTLLLPLDYAVKSVYWPQLSTIHIQCYFNLNHNVQYLNNIEQ